MATTAPIKRQDSQLDVWEMYVRRAAQYLRSDQRHLWEHATLLYRAYEWQSAADTFRSLADSIKNEGNTSGTLSLVGRHEATTLCLVNTGMIEARLGDYGCAVSSLRTASHADTGFPLPYFLLALIEFERGSLVKCDGLLHRCLDALQHWQLDDRARSPIVRLNASLVKKNIQTLRAVQLAVRQSPQSDDILLQLTGLPAEFIFDVPPAITYSNKQQSYLPRKFARGMQYITRHRPRELITTEQVTITQYNGPRCIRTTKEPSRLARDARGQSDSVKELARFIQLYAPDDNRNDIKKAPSLADGDDYIDPRVVICGAVKRDIVVSLPRGTTGQFTPSTLQPLERASEGSDHHITSVMYHEYARQSTSSSSIALLPELEYSAASSPLSVKHCPDTPSDIIHYPLEYLHPTVYVPPLFDSIERRKRR